MAQPSLPRAIRIVADEYSISAWLPALAELLKQRTGAQVSLALQAGGEKNWALASLLSLEIMLLRRGKPCWSDRIDRARLAPLLVEPTKPDLLIDLTNAGIAPADVPVLRPLYDTAGGEDALASALFFRGTPRISVLYLPVAGDAAVLAEGTASLEAASGIGGAMEAVWSRTATLLLKALAGPVESSSPRVQGQPLPAIGQAQLIRHGAKAIASAAARAAYRLCCHAPHWRIGWRFVDKGGDVWSRRDLGGTRWNVLADPVDHFYADPVPWHRDGRDHLFFEDLDHKTGKGIVSVVSFDADGKPGPAVPVLEEPWHLSYPFLIETDGQIWMIPEASLSGEIMIYRSVEFPHRWERHATLLSGLEAADATVVRHDGRFYMFAVVRGGVGGYSDTLSIWHADTLLGPWLPHRQNPVMVDDRAARPAGNFVHLDGVLHRPVQDCRHGYGAALGLARIDRLDPEHFAQEVETHLAPGAHWPGRKLHTLNKAGRLETIDGSIIRPRLAPIARLVDRHYQP